MTIDEIRQMATHAPTMMDVSEELKFVSLLIELPPENIRNEWNAFSEILDALAVSHTQAFFDVDANNRSSFFRFAEWLDSLAQEFEDPRRKAALRTAADHFRVEPTLQV